MKIRCLFALVFFLFTGTAGAVEITNVRHWAAPDHTRVVIDVGSEPSYEVEEGVNTLTLRFKESRLKKDIPGEFTINKPGIKKVVIIPAANDALKIEFLLDKYQKTSVFKLKKFQDKPDRVVVDIILEQEIKENKSGVAKPKVKPPKIIVIDPGHGGEDPGAIGKGRSYEKNIVLKLSREIKKEINKIPGYQAILTRDGDYYVSFSKRLQIARDNNASLFISVHADAARNSRAKGSSVYCLSTGAASSEAARLLAKNENLSDIIGGVADGDGGNGSDLIILNMFQTNTINLSRIYAGILLNHMGQVISPKYQNVQEAPFRVLKLPDIPAVLLETAYISNAEEEKLLKNSRFQKSLAVSVAASVKEYLARAEKTRPDKTGVNAGEDEPAGADKKETTTENSEKEPLQYRVRRGDTLFSIARQFNTRSICLCS
ncbi:MAG TPA: N-acetylmuramoyl-L-alanine amidase [Smithellaceae bacterium]|nr:N-acetylmuramoyl-L-alanine amidase [Smithellaceae bacterium]